MQRQQTTELPLTLANNFQRRALRLRQIALAKEGITDPVEMPAASLSAPTA